MNSNQTDPTGEEKEQEEMSKGEKKKEEGEKERREKNKRESNAPNQKNQPSPTYRMSVRASWFS